MHREPSYRVRGIATIAVMALTVSMVVNVAGPPAPAGASHGPSTPTAGIYRIPFVNGTDVRVGGDHHTHSPRNRIDLSGTGSDEPYQLVAAASGWIRAIRDHNGNSPNPGDGEDAQGTPYSDPDDDALEHSCQDAEDEEGDPIPDSVVPGLCQDYNNYVWIEHPNGEWTKYSHPGTGTVSALWNEGAWIDAGEVLGLQGDVGRATGPHLHHEVAVSDDPDEDLQWSELGGFIQNGSNIVPRVCDIGTVSPGFYDDDFDDGEDEPVDEPYTANSCDHQPPTAHAGGPYVMNEGSALQLNGAGSDDPEGNPLTYVWELETDLPDSGNLLDDPSIAQPLFQPGDDGLVDVTLNVYDQIEALPDSDDTTITVNNVAPNLTIDPGQVTVIDENGTVSVEAEFTDPGFGDMHTATIEWGAPLGQEGIELSPPSIQIVEPGGPGGVPLRGRVTGQYRYGDNDDGVGFTIEVSVTDDDGGADTTEFVLTVGNVNATAQIDLSGGIVINGVPTIAGEAGVPLDLTATADDPGSDDLIFEWDFADGATALSPSLVNAPLPEPVGIASPTVQPRVAVPDTQEHTYGDACMYRPSVEMSDDDGGTGPSDWSAVLIAGNADDSRPAGWWQQQYKLGGVLSDFSVNTLDCYLVITRFASAVFEEERVLSSLDDADAILQKQGTLSAQHRNLDRELLTAWLNFANGAFEYDELVVDTDGDDAADMSFADALAEAESVRLDPGASEQELVAARQLVHQVNQA